jgi:hypothetical protein
MSIGPPIQRQRGLGLAHKPLAPLCGLLALLLAAGCATPVGVERADPQSVHRELTGNVLSTGELSDFTQNVLRLGGIAEAAENDPEAAIATLHEAVVTGLAGPNARFAYAELAFKHASQGGGQRYYLASAVYAFAYLFPDGEGEAPSPFDPRYRWAVELYNLAVTKAFETAGGADVDLRSGSYELPFGRLDVAFDEDQLVWGDLRLTEFAPAAELEVRGLRNRYRRPGLGAPLAAATSAARPVEGFQVAAKQRVPVTALLRIDDARSALAERQINASLELYTPTDPEQTTIAGRAVPLEVEPTASLAFGLSNPEIWATEYRGFLFGDLLRTRPTNLVAMQPHQPGHPGGLRAWHGLERRTLGRHGERSPERSGDPRPLRVLVLLLRDRQPDPQFRAAAAPGARAGGRIARSRGPGRGAARHGDHRPQPGWPARQDDRDRHRLAPVGPHQPQAAGRAAAEARDAGAVASEPLSRA